MSSVAHTQPLGPPGPLKPITNGQLKALHAIALRRGLSHDDLHAAAGVDTLKALSVAQAAGLIGRLQTADHRRAWEPGEPDRAAARGVLRNASERQRNYIAVLTEQLGWSAEKAAHWLRERHGIADLVAGVFSTRVASAAVYQLEQALLKEERKTANRGGFDMV